MLGLFPPPSTSQIDRVLSLVDRHDVDLLSLHGRTVKDMADRCDHLSGWVSINSGNMLGIKD